MTQPDSTTPAPADNAGAPAPTETLDEQIARLTAERDAAAAAAAPAPTAAAGTSTAPAGFAVGDLVEFHRTDRDGNAVQGRAFVSRIVEPYDRGDGTMTEPQYIVAPLQELGVYLDGDALEKV